MIKIVRLVAPQILNEKFEQLTADFLANPNKKVFDSNSKLYKDVKEILMLMTQEHCSFCDSFPIENSGDAIEHFRPSSLWQELAYAWENLYFICTKCNSAKGNRFDEKLLRPDEIEYFFDKFFSYNVAKSKLEPALDISEKDKERVNETIKIYKLNRIGNRKARKIMMKTFIRGKHERDDFPFRYIIDLELI